MANLRKEAMKAELAANMAEAQSNMAAMSAPDDEDILPGAETGEELPRQVVAAQAQAAEAEQERLEAEAEVAALEAELRAAEGMLKHKREAKKAHDAKVLRAAEQARATEGRDDDGAKDAL